MTVVLNKQTNKIYKFIRRRTIRLRYEICISDLQTPCENTISVISGRKKERKKHQNHNNVQRALEHRARGEK